MKAVIVGSQGQDGTLLTDLLVSKGYDVTGLHRETEPRIDDASGIQKLIRDLAPRDIYYLAAHHQSSEDPLLKAPELMARSYAVNVQGLVHFLEAIRTSSPQSRIFYASSSHVLGDSKSAYAITKSEAMRKCRAYRDAHGIFASIGILFNHESPLRPERFLSKKIVQGALRIKKGSQKELVVGNLSARVDWGYAPDFVKAMHLILQAEHPDDFIVATGKTHSVQDFIETTFELLSLDWTQYVREEPSLLTRQTETLEGNISKITRELGWKPATDFKTMIAKLVEAEQNAI